MFVDALAAWASYPKADQAHAARQANAAVNLAAGLWALQSERIRRDVRFNFWRDHSATLDGWPVGRANVWHRSSPFYSQPEVRAAEGGVRRLSRVGDRSGRKADRRR
jgi:hypothetical protein